MKVKRVFLLVGGLFVLAFFSLIYAEVPQIINYQGKITTPAGALVDTTVGMVFTIYDAPTDGGVLWTETQPSVVVEKGVFSVLMGSVNPIPHSVFTGVVLYLGVKVGADPEMTPRKKIVSVGYAYKAEYSDTADYSFSGAPDDDWDLDTAGINVYRLTGNVGIGTPTPQEKLDVAGTAQVTGFKMATDASDGYVLTSDANGVGTWQIAAGGIGGSGTANYVPKFTASTILGNSAIYETGSRVGIGTASPEFKLSLNNDGGIIAKGVFNVGVTLPTSGAGTRFIWYPRKAAIRAGSVNATQWNEPNIGIYSVAFGIDNVASGHYSTVAGGRSNIANGVSATVGGGRENTASGLTASTVGGGESNTASVEFATVAGGRSNSASSRSATVGGGDSNIASGGYSTVPGGWSNSVAGGYSFAAGSKVVLTSAAAHTFAFGNDFTTSTPNAVIFHNSVNPIKVGIGTTAPDKELHVVGNIKMVDGNQAAGKVLTSDASGVGTWQAAAGGDIDWTFRITDTADTTLITGGQWGIARAGNVLYGNEDSTHVNLGVACTTGASGQNYEYCTVGGGVGNAATWHYATVGGGYGSNASSASATVGGGRWNYASGLVSTIGGGDMNAASASYTTVAGGGGNFATETNATVGGGYFNRATGSSATVPGGLYNLAAGDFSLAAGDSVRISSAADYTFAFGRNFTTSTPNAVIFHNSVNPIKVGIGTVTPQGALDVNSTTGALIVPRMTTAQRDALSAVNGMIIYNTTTNQFNFYENGAWVTK